MQQRLHMDSQKLWIPWKEVYSSMKHLMFWGPPWPPSRLPLQVCEPVMCWRKRSLLRHGGISVSLPRSFYSLQTYALESALQLPLTLVYSPSVLKSRLSKTAKLAASIRNKNIQADLRWILYQLSHQGSPRILKWVDYPFSRGFLRPRNQTGVSCIAGRFFTSWATKPGDL